jgi:hypothetical protein
MPVSRATRTAAVLVGIEAVGVLALAALQVVSLSSGVASLSSAIALLVLTVAGAVAVAAFARAILRGQSWGRSGAVVVQLLIIAVAIGAATGEYAHPGMAFALAVPAAVVFVVVILAARDAGRDQPRTSED